MTSRRQHDSRAGTAGVTSGQVGEGHLQAGVSAFVLKQGICTTADQACTVIVCVSGHCELELNMLAVLTARHALFSIG